VGCGRRGFALQDAWFRLIQPPALGLLMMAAQRRVDAPADTSMTWEEQRPARYAGYIAVRLVAHTG